MTVCILNYRACETDELSQITGNVAASTNEGGKRAKVVTREKKLEGWA